MSGMRKILQDLNKEIGVKGSMVANQDGLVVMAELSSDINKDVVAAMASNTIKFTNKSLSLLGCKRFERFILVAAHGRMVFIDIEPACLIVLTDKNINIDLTLLEIDGAARRIKNVWKM